MTKNIKKQIGIFLITLLFLSLSLAYVSASDVTRSFSTATPAAGSSLTVSLAVNVVQPDTFYIIDEILPAGWAVSNPGTGDTTQPGHIKWAVITGAVSTVNQYTVTVPNTALGVNTFSGEFGFDSNPAPLQILGDANVDVQPAAGNSVLASVSVTPATVSIASGGTQQLTANPLDQNSAPFVGAVISWSSSNTAVATVDANGLVSAVSAGTATITATATSGAIAVTGTSAIAVSAQGSVSSVTRSFSTATPAAGSSLTVSLAVNVVQPDTFYIIDEILPAGWAVSNPGTGDTTQPGHIKWAVITGAVSTVNQYTVTVPNTALGVNTFSGEFGFDSNPAPLQILGDTSVNVPPPQALTSVTVSPATVTITTGATQQLIASPLDQNGLAFAGATVSWSSNNNDVATVDANGLVSAVSAGTAIITATATATSGAATVSGTSEITVTSPAPPAPSGGGGGGGGSSFSGSSSQKESFIGFGISAGSSTTKTLTTPSIAISAITIKAGNTIINADLTIEKLSAKPALTGELPGKIFQFLEIKHSNIQDSDIAGATIHFKVDNSWISAAGLKEEDIALFRLVGNEWVELKTAKTGFDSASVSFQAESPGFSYYAIGQKAVVEKTATSFAEVPKEQNKEAAAAPQSEPEIIPNIESSEQGAEPVTGAVVNEGVNEGNSAITLTFWIVFSVFVALTGALALALFAVRRQRYGPMNGKKGV